MLLSDYLDALGIKSDSNNKGSLVWPRYVGVFTSRALVVRLAGPMHVVTFAVFVFVCLSVCSYVCHSLLRMHNYVISMVTATYSVGGISSGNKLARVCWFVSLLK